MNYRSTISFLVLALVISTTAIAQRAIAEKVNYYGVRTPNSPLDPSITTYKVIVEHPYDLTIEELTAQSKADFEAEKASYATLLKESEEEFQDRLANHDNEVQKAEDRYDKEMADYKSLSLLERLSLADQGKKPQLKVPAKPTYVKPREPRYTEPNLGDHLIFDDKVMADGIELLGFDKGEEVVFLIHVTKMQVQDNGGQTFYSQPTTLKVMNGATLIDEKVFDKEFKFLTSSTSNTVNLDRLEKNNVNKLMKEINTYMNEEFGFIPVAASIKIEYPKNKKREYDELENAKNKAISAYRKMKKTSNSETRARATSELEKVREIWKTELTKVDFKDKKAVFNKKVGRMILYNLLRVDLTLKDKAQAEETLEMIQERRIDLDLGYDAKNELTKLEEAVYKL